MNAEAFEERMDVLQNSIEAISQNQEHLDERIDELAEEQKESSAGDVAALSEDVEALRTGVKNLLENQQTLNEHVGEVSDGVDMIATADGTSQQSASLTEEEVLEAAAENARDTRSKAELFGVADD
jgi:chaperonin cofactor prefoldin